MVAQSPLVVVRSAVGEIDEVVAAAASLQTRGRVGAAKAGIRGMSNQRAASFRSGMRRLRSVVWLDCAALSTRTATYVTLGLAGLFGKPLSQLQPS